MVRRIAEFLLGQVGAQIISIAALAALAAIVSGETLASYGLALAVGSVVGANISLRIELAILASDPDILAKLATASLALGLTPSIAGFVLALYVNEFGALSAGLAYGSMVSVAGTMQALLIVKQRSRLAGSLLLARSAVLASAVVGCAILGKAEGEEIASALAFASVGWMLIGVFVSVRMVGCASPRDTFRAVSENRGAWLPLLGQSVTSSVSLNLPYLVVSQQFPSALVAAYLVSEKTVKLPIALLSYSLRSHMIPFFRSERGEYGPRSDFPILRWSMVMWVFSFSAIIVGSVGVSHLPIELKAVDLASVGHTVQIMSAWAASSVALPLASAYLQARGASGVLFRNQASELLGKVIILIGIMLIAPSYYIAVAAIFAWPLLANLLVVRTATNMQRGSRR